MRLHYFHEVPNFGDRLNPWLWGRLIPDLLARDDDLTLVGIGTILDHKIPTSGRKIIFGSGTGYADCAPIDASWEFLCVRGPMTASRLGLAPETAVTDGAALLATVERPTGKRLGRAVFIPHFSSVRHWDWASLCERTGIEYLDPLRDVDEVLGVIAGAEVVIAEAMHGAIVADTLRVPWAPLCVYPHINRFKWTDWCLSLGMQYEPVQVDPLYNTPTSERRDFAKWSSIPGLIGKIERTPEHARWVTRRLTAGFRMQRREEGVASIFREISDGRGVRLSDPLLFADRVNVLRARLARLRAVPADGLLGLA